MFKFETIRFKVMEKEDLKYIHEWENDYELYLYTRANPLHFISSEEVESEYNDLQKNKNMTKFIIENIKDNNPIGAARIAIREGDVRSAEIGVFIAERSQWSKGLGKLITIGLLEMLFYHRSFEKVFAGSAEFNKRAHKVLEYCGLKKEGEFRKDIKLYGKYYSLYMFGELYEEYMQIREKVLREVLKESYDEYKMMTSQLG